MTDQAPGRRLVFVRRPEQSEILTLAWEAAILDRAQAISQSTVAHLRRLLGDDAAVLLRAEAARPDPPAGKASSRPASTGGRRLHILVVEDRAAVRESWCALLGLWGFAVTSARDGPEAVAAAGAFPPDMVLMDLGLPTIDGYETARRIRRLTGGRGPQFLALTARGTEPDRKRSEREGFACHLRKPVEPSELQDVLARIAGETAALPGRPAQSATS